MKTPITLNTKEGYWYKGKKRLGKYFTNINGHKIWAKKLERINYLESLRWLVAERIKENYTKQKSIWNEIKIKKYAHYKVENNWRQWHYDQGLSSSWTKKPKKILNNKLGHKIYEMEKNNNKWYRRKNMLNSIFRHAILSILYSIKFNENIVEININGRQYTFIFTTYDSSLQNIIYPENKKIILEQELIKGVSKNHLHRNV